MPAVAQKIIFDHRQKTAGTSLRAVFCAVLGDERVSPLLLEGTFPLARHLLRQFDAVCGHLDLPTDYDFPPEIYHLTLLRHPVERLLSHVSFLREVDDNDGLSNYLRDTDIATIIDQGRELPETLWNGYAHHFARGAADLLQSAKEVLRDSFHLVGITEELPTTVALLSDGLGWPTGRSIPHERQTRERITRDSLAPRSLRRLEELMHLDLPLYEHALALFRERVRISGDEASPKRRRHHAPAAARPARASAAPLPAATPAAEPTPIIALRRGEAFGLSSVSPHPGRGEELDLAFEVVPAIALRRLDFRVRIFNDWQLLLYEEQFDGARDVAAGQRCEFGIRFELILGLGLHLVDLLVHAQQVDGSRSTVEFRRACDFVVERSPRVTSTGLVALAAKSYTRPSATAPIATAGLRLSVLQQPARLACGAASTARIAVTNGAETPLEIFGVHRFTLGYHTRDTRSGEVAAEGPRTSLGRDVASGETIELEAAFVVPPNPGHYVIEWDLVQEWVAWLGVGCAAPLEAFAEETPADLRTGGEPG